MAFDIAFAASWWMVVAGAATMALTRRWRRRSCRGCCRYRAGDWRAGADRAHLAARRRWLFGTPLERQPSDIMLLQKQIHAAWTTGGTAPAAGVPGHVLT